MDYLVEDHEKTLVRLEALARLMDSAIEIPGTTFRIGVDALVGLVPGIGDGIGAVVSAYIIREAHRIGVPKHILMKMVWNVTVDSLIGIVPLIGDFADARYKANLKNVELLRKHLKR